MADKTGIQWTDATWNPVTGCSKVSPGCANCYAEALTMRYAKPWGVPGLPWTPENAAQNVILRPDRLDQPLRWRKPRMVFVNSMSDLFHERVPDEFILAVWAVMEAAPQHVYQILTKRPERMRDLLADATPPPSQRKAVSQSDNWRDGTDRRYSKLPPIDVARIRIAALSGESAYSLAKTYGVTDTQVRNIVRGDQWGFKVLPSTWLGVSIENRRYVDRADLLRETPAAVRFISAEPLLGPLVRSIRPRTGGGGLVDTTIPGGEDLSQWGDGFDGPSLALDKIDWLIVGGESGKGHRPIRRQWVTDLRDACLDGWPSVEFAEGVLPGGPQSMVIWRTTAFFFKQWGGPTPKSGGRELDGQTYDEMPEVAP